MKKVAIFPPWNPWLGNRMFEDAEGCIYTPSFRRWKKEAAAHGFELGTHDICPSEKADVVWFMDLPRQKRTYVEARRTAPPGARFVLQILESPLFFPAAFVETNRRAFDAVVSYEFRRDGDRTFHCPLPVEIEPGYEGMPFRERKLAVMVNTNRVEGWFSTRKTGWVGLPGVGGYFSGWKMPRLHWLRPAKGQLYNWRRRLAREAEKRDVGNFEIFGPGWRGEAISWFRPLHARAYRCHQAGSVLRDGRAEGQNKRARMGNYRFVIASENFLGRRGYVSEKIFDAILGGSVPVYHGEKEISAIVPQEAFVDAARFGRPGELLRYLREMPEDHWNAMREAGRRFLKSDAFRPFTGELFGRRMAEILTKI